MSRINKIICIFLIFAFFINTTFLPVANACWWKGMMAAYSSPTVSGKPTEDNAIDDDKKNQTKGGDPILIHNGDFVYENQDLVIPGRQMNIEIKRTYKSQSSYNGRFGFGWDMNYSQKIVPLANGNVYYLEGYLKRFEFGYIDGTNYISPAGIYDKLVQNVDGTFTLTEQHGLRKNFDQNGCLSQIVDRNNNTLTFTYDPAGKLPIIGIPEYSDDLTPRVIAYDYKLIRITDTVGRQINFTYNDDGKLISITDFAGRTYSYNYDPSGNGDLISFTTPATTEFPLGNTTTYAYLDHNLTSITDAKGQTYLTNHYDSNDRVDWQNYGSGTFNFYYGMGAITTVTNPKGYATEYNYDQNGSVVSKKERTSVLRPSDPSYYLTAYTYNSALERTSVTYPKGNGIKYVFDEGNPDFVKRGNLLEIRKKTDMAQPDNDTNDIVTRFTYEPNFNFIQTITDPKGNVTTFNYDTNGNLVAIVYPQAGGQIPQTTITYNTFGQIETVTDPNNNLTRYEYFPETGYLKKIIQDPTGINAVTQFAYDSVGNVTSVINANNLVTNFTYNAQNQLTSQTIANPFNYLFKYYYDANGNLTKIENRGNAPSNQWQITEYSYTALDQLQTIKQYLNPTTYLQTSFTYDLNGNRTSITDANNKTTNYTYDERDLIWKTTLRPGSGQADAITEYFYDQNANLAKIKDAKSQETTYAYDDFERLETTTYADTSYKEFSYDKNSNLVGLQSPNSNLISYAYDSLNRLDLKTYPDATTVDYVYDLGSRLTSVICPLSSMDYTYDTLNRITSNTNTLNATPYTLTYEYDKLGNRTRVTYPSGKDIRYTYDLLSQLTKITQDNNTLATFAYDFLGRRYQKDLANTIAKRTTYQYDLVNRLTQIKNTIISSQPPGGIKYPVEQGLLDNDQELLAYPVIRESGTRESGYPDIRDKIVPDNLITQSPSPGSPDNPMSLSNKYPIESGALNDNSFGGGDGLWVLSRVMGFGLWGNNSQLTLTTRPTTHNTPSELGSLINPFSTQDAFAEGPKLNTQYTYTYDNTGNRLSRQIQSTSIGNSNENYAYDDVYQLTNLQSAISNQQYDYDAVGNREVVTLEGLPTNYISNNLNQYTQVGANSYTNDANGNLTTDGTNTYGYDYEDRLTSIEHPGSSIQYQYDSFGRRISRTIGGLTTYFIYDGDQIIEERDASGSLTASYVYGTGIDEVLTMDRAGQTYYYFYDGLGSVTEITNAAGEVEESYQYDVYGNPSQVSTIGNRFMFTGREYDAESGLYHYRARAYSPTIGRFLQRDPVTWGPDDPRSLACSSFNKEILKLADSFGLKDTITRQYLLIQAIPSIISLIGTTNPALLHLYSYCANNPVNWVDSFGFDKDKPWWQRPEVLVPLGLSIGGFVLGTIGVFTGNPVLGALGYSMSLHGFILGNNDSIGNILGVAGLGIGAWGMFSNLPFINALGLSIAIHGLILTPQRK